MAYRAVDHEPKQILDIIKGHDRPIALPHALPVGFVRFDQSSNSGEKLGVVDGDLDIRVLCVALKAVHVLAHRQGDRVDGRCGHGELGFEEYSVFGAIIGTKRYRSLNIEVVFEVFDMEENRISILSNTKQLNGRLAAVEESLFSLNGLKTETVCSWVVGRW